MLSTVYSAGLCGIDGFIVSVECDAQERGGGVLHFQRPAGL